MSGPKVSVYDLEQARKRQLEEEARRKQQKIAEEMRKVQKELEEKKRASDAMLSSVSRMMEEEQRKQRERERQRIEESKKAAAEPKTERKGMLSGEDVPKALDFRELLEQASKEAAPSTESRPDVEELLRELEQEPVELRSLLDAYIPKIQEKTSVQEAETNVSQTKDDSEEFDELLLLMEREYREIVRDRAFFKQQRERILAFEEICKRQQEYHSYQILRDVYYGEFQKIKNAREKWHAAYEKWKPVFEEVYVQYCAACEMLGVAPQHYFLNVETVEEDVAKLREELERLEKEYIQKQESLAITTALNEVMAEMGYQVLGTKNISKKSGGQVQNTVFSFGEGSGIHVMDSGERITMEIVGLDDSSEGITDEEKDYLMEEQEIFCDSFREIEEALKKKGVVVRNRIKLNAPSRDFSAIMNMQGYTMTEESKKVKKLAKVDKKKNRTQKAKDKKYINE